MGKRNNLYSTYDKERGNRRQETGIQELEGVERNKRDR